MPDLLLATNNKHKLDEFKRLLGNSRWNLLSPNEIGISLSSEETGDSYESNVRTKAMNGSISGLTVLADDSGLEIDAIPNELGYLSARFLGPESNYKDRCQTIIERLKGLPLDKRTARFRSVVAI